MTNRPAGRPRLARRRGARIAATTLAALTLVALSACGSGNAPHGTEDAQGTPPLALESSGPTTSEIPAPPIDATPAPTETKRWNVAPQDAGPGPAPQNPGSAPQNAGPAPQNASPRARPADATPITAIHRTDYGGDRIAVITSPSGNIGCDFGSGGYAGCGVLSLIQNKAMGVSIAGHAIWWVDLKGATAKVLPKGDAPFFQYPAPRAQIVPYGTSVYHGDYICRSEEANMTCWNTRTGAGAILERNYIKPFVR